MTKPTKMDRRRGSRVAGGTLLLLAAGEVLVGLSIALAFALVIGGIILLAMSFGTKGAAEVQATNTAKKAPRSLKALYIATVVVSLVVAAALVTTFVVAQGDARGHASFHFLFGAAGVALFLGIGLLWRPPRSREIGRNIFLVALWIGSVATLLEAIGAAGYDAQNDGIRIPALAPLHNLAAPGAALGFFLVPLAVVVFVFVVVSWLLQRRHVARG